MTHILSSGLSQETNKFLFQLKKKSRTLANLVFLSVASLWEITIKEQLGKLSLGIPLQDLFDYADRNQIEIIHIASDHLLTLSKLPDHHRDPFDRLIISQAISENLILLTRDKELKKYKVKQQWS